MYYIFLLYGTINNPDFIDKEDKVDAFTIIKSVELLQENKSVFITIKVLDLNDYEMPIYSIDRENEEGVPELAKKLLNDIAEGDGIILSLAEHNGVYAAAFKNVMDWMSRLEREVWAKKPMLLMAASPGGRGGQSVLELAKSRLPFLGAEIKAEYSFPLFYDNFKDGIIVNQDLRQLLIVALDTYKESF